MDSPFSPLLVNLFMGHHEKLWLENWQGSEVLFYRRYVDDTFCLFLSENDALLFFNYITFRHHNIRFTKEKEIDHKIPFLDVLINSDTRFPVTSVYRKKTFTDLLTNCFNFILYPYKLGHIRILVDRAYKINSTWLDFRNSLKSLERIFFQPICLKGLSIGTSPSPVMRAIPRSPYQTLLLTSILNYLTLALFVLSRKKRFTNLLSVIVTTPILSWFFHHLK